MHPGGMGPPFPGTIPWSLVMKWCEHHGLTFAESELLDRCLLGLDAEYQEWWGKQQQVTGKKSMG